jgi:phosphoglycerate dehydrogenase-like enzyme
MTRLLIYRSAYERVRAALDAHGAGLRPIVVNPTGEAIDAGVVLARGEARPDIAWLSADLWHEGATAAFWPHLLGGARLKWVQSAAAGFDNGAFISLVAQGTRLSTSHGQAVGIADYVLAGVLDVFQRGPERRAAQSARAWTVLPFRAVAGSRWVIVGFGAIGQAVAQRAKAFGAQVVGLRRNLEVHPFADRIAPLTSLVAEAADADVVVLCVPLNRHTRGIAGEALFGAMKRHSVLVNVGRGALVDEAALLGALDRGIPAHAVLDVFATEPLPPESAFWSHPRVSLTAHCSGVTRGDDAKNDRVFLDNLGRYLSGQPLLNEADPSDVLAGRAD